MTSINVSLPRALKSFLDDQVCASGYSTSGEYVRELIRKDQDRKHLRGLLLEGAASPQAAEADEDFFSQLRDRVHKAAQE